MNVSQKTMREEFRRVFGREGEGFFFAPGRVNLIGEHTDYNGGYVLPCAITFGTYALAARRDDGRLRLFSLNFPRVPVIEAPARGLKPDKKLGWGQYPLGVAYVLERRGLAVGGADILYWGDLPHGAGLSSSASIEVLTAVVLSEFGGLGLPGPEMARLGQSVENDFVGVQCGIMDQFIVACGRAGTALLLNCDTMKYEYAPLELGAASLVIIDSGKRRGLADSKYNQRRAECEAALAAINREAPRPLKCLCDMTEDDFGALKGYIREDVPLRRARHEVTENARTIKAARELAAGHLAGFGRLMNASHASLRDDYEVTGPELDALAAAAQAHPACLGARMTGAGFGGCAVALLSDKAAMDDFQARTAAGYKAKTGLEAKFYPVAPADGAKALQ